MNRISGGFRSSFLVAVVLLACVWAPVAVAQGPQAAPRYVSPSGAFLRHYPAPADEPAPTETPTERKLRIGIRGGLAMGKYYGDSTATYIASNYGLGPVGGLNLTLLLSDHVKSRFYFTPELLFNMRGVRRNTFTQASTQQAALNASGVIQTFVLDSSYTQVIHDRVAYAQVPLLFRMDFGSENVRPYFAIGPYLAFAVSGKNTIRTNVTQQTLQIGADNRVIYDAFQSPLYGKREAEYNESRNLDSLSTFDWGGILNVGCQFPITSRVNLLTEVRYDVGFARVFDEYRIKNRNQSWCFIVGVEF